MKHRTAVLIVIAVLLGIFVPIPGFLVAGLFWHAGIHELNSMREGIAFLAVLFGVSFIAWAALANLLLPRKDRAAGKLRSRPTTDGR